MDECHSWAYPAVLLAAGRCPPTPPFPPPCHTCSPPAPPARCPRSRSLSGWTWRRTHKHNDQNNSLSVSLFTVPRLFSLFLIVLTGSDAAWSLICFVNCHKGSKSGNYRACTPECVVIICWQYSAILRGLKRVVVLYNPKPTEMYPFCQYKNTMSPHN